MPRTLLTIFTLTSLLSACGGGGGGGSDAGPKPQKTDTGTATDISTASGTSSSPVPAPAPAPAPDTLTLTNAEECRAKGDDYIFQYPNRCILTPVISAEGALEQKLVLGEEFTPVRLTERAGRAVTWSIRNGWTTDELFSIQDNVLAADLSQLEPGWNYPRTWTLTIVGTVEGLRSNEITVKLTVDQTPEQACGWRGADHVLNEDGNCVQRPRMQAYLTSEQALTGQTIGQGDFITPVHLDIRGNAESDNGVDYVIEDQTCPDFFKIAPEPSDRYTYQTLYGASTATTPAGDCEGKLYTRQNGVLSQEFKAVKVRVAEGRRVYGYCIDAQASAAVKNAVALLKNYRRASTCEDLALKLRTTTELTIDGGAALDGATRDDSGRMPLDLAPLNGVPLKSLTIVRAAVTGVPALTALQSLALADVATSELAAFASVPLISLELDRNVFPDATTARAAVSGIKTLRRLRLGAEGNGFGRYAASQQGSGLSGLPALEAMSSLEKVEIFEPAAFDLTIRAPEGLVSPLASLLVAGARIGTLTLENLPNLKTLDLDGTSVAQAKLQGLPALTSVTLALRPGNAVDLVSLAKLGRVNNLQLILPAGARPRGIEGLESLSSLTIQGGVPDPAFLTDLIALQAASGRLRDLTLPIDASWTQGETLRDFGKLGQLESLTLSASADASLAQLVLPKELWHLSIRGGKELDVASIQTSMLGTLALHDVSLATPATATRLVADLFADGRSPMLHDLSLVRLGLLDGDTAIPDAAAAQLTALRLAGNPLTSSAWLKSLTSLKTLSLAKTQITDLDGLVDMKDLETLDLTRGDDSPAKVTDLAPLAGLTHLKFLDADGQGMTSLMPLVNLPGLRRLSFGGSSVERVEDSCPIHVGSAALKQACYFHVYGLHFDYTNGYGSFD